LTNGTGSDTWEARSWILVVDDDEDILEAIHTVLGRHGFRTVVTSNAQTALRILRRSPPPAAIVVDLRMPFMNGVDLVRAIRNKPGLSDMRIIGLSGDEDGRNIADDLALDEYLCKPVDIQQLVAAVQRALPATSGAAAQP
jgi:CheY-like chemotaxis protein